MNRPNVSGDVISTEEENCYSFVTIVKGEGRGIDVHKICGCWCGYLYLGCLTKAWSRHGVWQCCDDMHARGMYQMASLSWVFNKSGKAIC